MIRHDISRRTATGLIAAGVAAPFIRRAEAQQAAGATFTLLHRLSQNTLDPAFHQFEADAFNIVNCYEPLFYPVRGAAPSPHLAERTTISDDGLSYTFQLRRNVRFADGKPLTARDVVYSMDRMLRINRGYATLWTGLLEPGRTDAVDDNTVRMRLIRRFGPFLETLVQFFVVNSELLKANQAAGQYGDNGDYGTGYLARNTAGSGPYQLESIVPDARRILVRNPHYWEGWPAGKYDRAVIEIVNETTTARGLILSGRASMIDQWHAVDFYKNWGTPPQARMVEQVNNQLYIMQFNNQRPPFDDVEFRKAVSYAFDYDTAIRDLLGGAAVARGAIPEPMPGYDASTPHYQRNVARAREHLARSRYRPADHPIDYMFLNAGVHEPAGLLLQANLAEIGIRVNLKPEQWPTITRLAAQAPTAPHIFPVYNTANYPSPDAYIFRHFHPGNAGGWQAASWYNNREVHAMIDRARETLDHEQRNRLFAEAGKRIVDDAAALLVAYPTHRVILAREVEGYVHPGILGLDMRVYPLTRRA